ncbi:MAG: ACT domain-containing protein [Candidatus Micrarchaeia archaeon]
MKVRLFQRPVSLITAFGENVRVTPGVLFNFSSALYKENINLYACSSGEDSITFIVDYADEDKAFTVLRNTIKAGPTAFSDLVLRSNKSLITVDASDLVDTPGVAHAAISGLAREKINIIELFSSYGNITIALDPEYRKRAYDLIVDSLKLAFKQYLEPD